MLSSMHTSSAGASPSAARARAASIGVARSPRPLLAARTLEEVRERVGTVLRGLLHHPVRCELFVADARGRLAAVAARPGAAASDLRRLVSAARRPHVAVSAALAADAPRTLRSARRGALLAAELVDAADRPIGLLAVEGPPDAPCFTPAHAEVVEGVAALVSLAVQRLRTAEAESLSARVELDRRAARRVQRRLMRRTLPAGIGVTALAEYLPALDVGGDFYGLRHLADGTVTAAIGDVSGHGVAAALLMSRVAADVDRALAAGSSPAGALAAVNDALADVESESFVTACCLRLDPRTRRLTSANAGHLPLVVRRASGEVFTFGGASGLPLGVLPGAYQDEALVLEPRDVVLLVTDGVLEALDYPGGERGLDVLARVVGDGPHDARGLHARLRAAVEGARQLHALDDVTWVVLQVAA